MSILILKKEDVAKVLTMKDTIDSMRHCFLMLYENQADIPLRTVIKIPEKDAVSLFMPAFLPADNQLGIKIISSFPTNKSLALATINGAILLINSQTGQPKALIEASLLTALRTGAASGLATDLLAKKDAKTLAIIGSGVQARTQLEAMLAVRNITDVRIFSRNIANAKKFVLEVQSLYPSVSFIITDNAQNAVKNADIICTATSATEPVLYLDHLKEGCHINTIGSHSREMKELDLSIIRDAKIIVDQRRAAIAEAGEIISGLESNIINESDLIEIGALINQTSKHNELKNELTVFKSVGLAIQDLSAAEKAYKLAMKNNIGINVDF